MMTPHDENHSSPQGSGAENYERWQAAQRYERSFWSRVAERIAEGASDKLEFYEWRSRQLINRLTSAGYKHLVDGSIRTLEIGSGPIGISPYFPAQERVALDPLESFYREKPRLIQLRDPAVSYLSGVGEDIPCEDDHFNLVIMENCIDHVSDPAGVMSEIRRVLLPSGVLYLTVNCRTRWGYFVHRLLSRLRIDAGHPYTFTSSRVQRNLLHHHGFQLLQLEESSRLEAWLSDLRGPGLKPRLKALLGVSEHLMTVLAAPSSS